jgi:hypothetical protein
MDIDTTEKIANKNPAIIGTIKKGVGFKLSLIKLWSVFIF